jgi:hypothetical protein
VRACVCVRACLAYIREEILRSGFLRYIVSDSGFLRSGLLRTGKLRSFVGHDSQISNWSHSHAS